jgi:hypothetical protein
LAKTILKINQLRSELVTGKGYKKDYNNFTELIWKNCRNMDFYDGETYHQFQPWVLGKGNTQENLMNFTLLLKNVVQDLI